MRHTAHAVVAGCTLSTLVVGVISVDGQTDTSERTASDRPYGIAARVPWTTSRIRGTPDPPSDYRTESAFPKLRFDEPLDMTVAPKSDRMFVVERYGRIYSFPNDPTTESATLFLDLNEVLGRGEPKTMSAFGFAVHPRFDTNGHVYVTYVIDSKEELPRGTRLSRFRARADDPLRADPSSETILLEWPSGGHNGGCVQFGPDGYLHVATGDSSGIADAYLTGQDLGSLPGSILRIDVDRADDGRNYAIPQNNPFRSVAGARPEIWAYGLRQPWKISFDRASGDLWTGNVGQDLWEQIYRIERGGNYGWSLMEGSHPFRPERRQGPTPILPPVAEHDHTGFRSITGGFVYHGTRLPELSGAYVYGDYDTGKIWAMWYDRATNGVSQRKELVDSSLRLVGFAEDNAGELYLVDHMSGGIHRLARNPNAGRASDFPRRLSETGLFASVPDHAPAPGLIPYTINSPRWCDGGAKEWFLALPGTSQIEYETLTYPQPAPGAPPGWKFPNGTVLVETLSLDMRVGDPASRRRLETRILHHERTSGSEEVGDQVWQGYTYVWNDEQTDAELLDAPQGMDRTFTIQDPDAADGRRQQTWHFPGRAECIVCHNMAAKYALGVNTLQFNKNHDYGGRVDNQLRTLEHIGVFTESLPARPERLPRLAEYRDETVPLEKRARAYLHANCSHCHRKWGGGNAEFQLLATLPLSELGIVNERPGQGTFFLPDARVVAPADPYRSILFYRMAKLGTGRMPRLGANVVDESGLRLIHDWIAAMPSGVDDSPSDARTQTVDQRLETTREALRLMWAVSQETAPRDLRDAIVAAAMQHKEPSVRDLFERFVPEEKRVRRLGTVIRPDEILSRTGDIDRGRDIFFNAAGVQCQNCHRLGGQGTELGPDLSAIGKKYSRTQLLDAILDPSKDIDAKYATYIVETSDGLMHAGILVQNDETAVVLKDAENKEIRVPAADVERKARQPRSLMPDLLLRDLTAQDVADLTAFLSAQQ